MHKTKAKSQILNLKKKKQASKSDAITTEAE